MDKETYVTLIEELIKELEQGIITLKEFKYNVETVKSEEFVDERDTKRKKADG